MTLPIKHRFTVLDLLSRSYLRYYRLAIHTSRLDYSPTEWAFPTQAISPRETFVSNRSRAVLGSHKPFCNARHTVSPDLGTVISRTNAFWPFRATRYCARTSKAQAWVCARPVDFATQSCSNTCNVFCNTEPVVRVLTL